MCYNKLFVKNRFHQDSKETKATAHMTAANSGMFSWLLAASLLFDSSKEVFEPLS